MALPKLSIIIPNYNHGHLLKDAVDSVATRNQSSVEIIIIDDASTDNSLEVIDGLRQKYSNIRLIKHKNNHGVAATINEGTLLARGEYVHYLSADDKRLPLFIEKTMSVLEKHPNIPMCCSAGVFVDENKTRHTRHYLPTKVDHYIFDPITFSKVIRRSNYFFIAGHTTIIKKSAVLKYGGYDDKLGLLIDWYLFHNIALHEGVAYLPEALSEFYFYSTSYSESFNKKKLLIVYRYLLELIEQDQYTRKLFRKTGLLRGMVKALFKEMVIEPKYWNYIFPLVIPSIVYRFEKYSGIKINKFFLKKLLRSNQQ